MSQTFKGQIPIQSNFDVQYTAPLDARLVVNSREDLTTIEAPYQGMVVNIAETSELWILTRPSEEAGDLNSWKLVTGSGGGNGLSKYSLPVMTPAMVDEASVDPDIDFDGSEDPYILAGDYDMSSLDGESTMQMIGMPSENNSTYVGTYLDIMMRTIRGLQEEVARLKNSFDYGIDSYKNERTAKSAQKSYYEDIVEREPLWAIDPGYLSYVPDNNFFNTYLGRNHSFTTIGTPNIDVSVEDQLTFVNCTGVFSDGDSEGKNLTLYNTKDSKLITYLVTDKPDIKVILTSMDDAAKTREINIANLLNGNTVDKYGVCMVISRKVEDSKTKEKKGFNYIYFSIINYDTDEKLWEGYLTSTDGCSSTRVTVDERYSIKRLEFDRLTLSRMKFYTKFEDFSEEVISSAPSEDDWKYEVAHITIRSVEDSAMLERIKDQLRDNELIWNKAEGTLNIKTAGKIQTIGSNSGSSSEDNDNKDKNMTDKQIIEALNKMGIIVNVTYKADDEGNLTVIDSLENVSLAPISDFTFIHGDTGKKFTFTVDSEGNLVGKDKSAKTIEEVMDELGNLKIDLDPENYQAIRGFSADYLYRLGGSSDVNYEKDAGKKSDRLRISSFYAPITTDTVHGCTHSFIELENTSDKDIPLTGVYLHFYNPVEDKVYHLELDGTIKAGGTYLVRGAKHAEFDDESAFIKVRTFDKEWYDNKKLVSFEQAKVNTVNVNGTETMTDDSPAKKAYRFCLTYGLPNLQENDTLVVANSSGITINGTSYSAKDFPNIIKTPRFIDSCAYSTFATLSAAIGLDNPWYANGKEGSGITIKSNTMFRLTFALDPAKQAYNGFNAKDGSRIRYNKGQDLQILKLDKEFIGFPHSDEIIRIDRYTPRASFENRNVMTDKTQLDREKPNMVTCSLGNDVYNTRCFNWISCGALDEYVWIRKQGTTAWKKFQSYTKISSDISEDTSVLPRRKEYSTLVNNTVYARMINRFPGNDVLFTAHKCVIRLQEATTDPEVYEYVVGRPDKDGKPDVNHTNEIYTFTLYPRTYEGRVYQITDQQGFHWIEYQVWAAAAVQLNTTITNECQEINSRTGDGVTKVFPILINTGDMTQSGSRINEWLDYYNAGKVLFNHLEQINCVGNNDLCDINPRELGTGNDNNKSNSHFFHYFYCFDVKDDDKYAAATNDQKKFFSGESLVVKAHTGIYRADATAQPTTVNITENRYIPSFYYFKTRNVMYIIFNSEIPVNGVQKWFGLCSKNNKYVNIYTGIEIFRNGEYGVYDDDNQSYFTPIYETMYAWMNSNMTIVEGESTPVKKVVVAMHEMPFTVITKDSLSNDKLDYISCTRNHPTGPKSSRVGSNVNQLTIDETRGIYWFSRLLEYFGCKLVIGGHKHTYALSYPIKEKYTWVNNTLPESEQDINDSGELLTNGKYNIKPMFATLEDEAGANPDYEINWFIELTDANKTEYSIASTITNTSLNSTKTPYIPENLYNLYGRDVFSGTSGVARCCSLLNLDTNNDGVIENENYDGFVTYSMCQATGYKLKSNKELPSCLQVFSKLIPYTDNTGTSDSPNGNQLFPMFSVLEFNDNCSEVNVYMVRISEIFKARMEDKFAQDTSSKNAMYNEYLCTLEKNDCAAFGTTTERNASLTNGGTFTVNGFQWNGKTCGSLYYDTDTNKIYVYTADGFDENENPKFKWTLFKERMYGIWQNESVAKSRTDNRYLHIKF